MSIERTTPHDRIAIPNNRDVKFEAWFNTFPPESDLKDIVESFSDSIITAHSRGIIGRGNGSGNLTPSDIAELISSRDRIEIPVRIEHHGYVIPDTNIPRAVLPDGIEVRLSNTEFRIFSIFMKNPVTVLDYNKLCRLVWGFADTIANLRAYITYIRTKIGDSGRLPDDRHIQTIIGRGYIFKPPNNIMG